MKDFQSGAIRLNDTAMAEARSLFASACIDDDATLEEIAQVWADNEYLLDPHTAIGTRAARLCETDVGQPMVTLATAHPAKFPAAVAQAVPGHEPELPAHLADLYQRPERSTVLPNDLAVVQAFMAEHTSR
jgi:threonine synthase